MALPAPAAPAAPRWEPEPQWQPEPFEHMASQGAMGAIPLHDLPPRSLEDELE
jgi:hypothetical protein